MQKCYKIILIIVITPPELDFSQIVKGDIVNYSILSNFMSVTAELKLKLVMTRRLCSFQFVMQRP